MLKDFPEVYGYGLRLRMSYGDLTKAERMAEARLGLTQRQARVLGWIIQFLDRDGYMTDLGGVVEYKLETIADYACLSKGKTSEALSQLDQLCIIHKQKAKGKRIHFKLTHQFVSYLWTVTRDSVAIDVNARKVSKPRKRLWTMGINSPHVPDAGNSHVPDAGNSHVPDAGNSHVPAAGNSHLYIEGLSLDSSPYPPSPSRSISLAEEPVDNVDNSDEAKETPASVLAVVINERSLKDAKMVIAAIEHEKGHELDLAYVHSFVRWMITKHVTPVDRNRALMEWYRWEEGIRKAHAHQEWFTETVCGEN